MQLHYSKFGCGCVPNPGYVMSSIPNKSWKFNAVFTNPVLKMNCSSFFAEPIAINLFLPPVPARYVLRKKLACAPPQPLSLCSIHDVCQLHGISTTPVQLTIRNPCPSHGRLTYHPNPTHVPRTIHAGTIYWTRISPVEPFTKKKMRN